MEDHRVAIFILGFILGAACTIGVALFVSQPKPDSGDWLEDAALSGNLARIKCLCCGRLFTGHERRIICCNCHPKPRAK